MTKRRGFTFVAIFIALGVLVPLWAISKEGSSSASPEQVPAKYDTGRELFATNCGTCHTLARAGTDGIVGPNLDDLLGTSPPDANVQRVLNAVTNGFNSPTSGQMPKGILGPSEAQQVALFVANEAGK
jgi:mono/diheme cytochrome c family protein